MIEEQLEKIVNLNEVIFGVGNLESSKLDLGSHEVTQLVFITSFTYKTHKM